MAHRDSDTLKSIVTNSNISGLDWLCVSEWLRSPPLTQEGLGLIPRAGKLDSGFHPLKDDKMSSSY